MFSPSLGDGPLGGTRRDNAVERGADALHDMLEWRPPTKSPDKPGTYLTKDRIGPRTLSRRVLFTGHFWMSDEPVAAWRGVTVSDMAKTPYRQLSHLAGLHKSALVAGGEPTYVQPRATKFEELSLEPIEDDKLTHSRGTEIKTLEQVAKLELSVEVVRFSKPKSDASGVVSGKVVVVSENYSAQAVGKDHVVIHENAKLDAPVGLGDRVTIAYSGGNGAVYSGIAHDINIVASWMPKDQQAYMRMVMLDALSMMDTPQDDDERLKDAMRYALESTASFFGLADSKLRRADIQLVVNEKESVFKSEGSEAAPQPRNRKP